MTCCKNKNQEVKGKHCPLCSVLGNYIHYLPVGMVVKEDVYSQVRKEDYFTCVNNDCDVVFFNKYNDIIFLVQDINMAANFKEITKLKDNKCESNSLCRNCDKLK